MPHTSLFPSTLSAAAKADEAATTAAYVARQHAIQDLPERPSSTASSALRAQITPSPDATWTPPRSVQALLLVLNEAAKFGPAEEAAAFKILQPELRRAQAAETFQAKQRIQPEFRYRNR